MASKRPREDSKESLKESQKEAKKESQKKDTDEVAGEIDRLNKRVLILGEPAQWISNNFASASRKLQELTYKHKKSAESAEAKMIDNYDNAILALHGDDLGADSWHIIDKVVSRYKLPKQPLASHVLDDLFFIFDKYRICLSIIFDSDQLTQFNNDIIWHIINGSPTFPRLASSSGLYYNYILGSLWNAISDWTSNNKIRAKILENTMLSPSLHTKLLAMILRIIDSSWFTDIQILDLKEDYISRDPLFIAETNQ